MKKLASVAVAVCFVGLCATAIAKEGSGPPQPWDKGNQGCEAPLFAPYLFANPGKWFQTIKQRVGNITGGAWEPNPAQWYDYLVDKYDVPFENLGDLVVSGCGTSSPQ
jgi:hypothetical protein